MSEHGYTKLSYFLIFNTKVPSTSGVFCGVRDTDKLEPLNKQALRLVFDDFNSNYPLCLMN